MAHVTCLRCKGVLIETVEFRPPSPIGKRLPPPPPQKKCEIELEDDYAFYRCPHCRAKNILMETRGENGFPRLDIVGFSLD
jgi:hypothetical protein